MVQRQIVAYFDQELSEHRQHLVQEHLERCGQCQALGQQMTTLTTVLHQHPEPPVPHGFAARIVEQVGRDARPQRVRWSLPWWLPIPAVVQAAAILLVALAGAHVGSATHAALVGGRHHPITLGTEFSAVAPCSVEGVYLDLLATVDADEPGEPLWAAG